MSIKKMLLLASMALAAIAFAAPATAQGFVQLTNSAGQPLATGEPVTAVSKNLQTTVGANRLTCQTVTLHYLVVTNGPNHVELEPTSKHNATAEGCLTHAFGFTFTNHITNAGTGPVTFNTWGTAETSATFTSNTTAIGRHCTYTGTVHLEGVAPSPSSTLDVGPSALAGAGEGCEPGIIHGQATIESNGKPVTGHFVATG